MDPVTLDPTYRSFRAKLNAATQVDPFSFVDWLSAHGVGVLPESFDLCPICKGDHVNDSGVLLREQYIRSMRGAP